MSSFAVAMDSLRRQRERRDVMSEDKRRFGISQELKNRLVSLDERIQGFNEVQGGRNFGLATRQQTEMERSNQAGEGLSRHGIDTGASTTRRGQDINFDLGQQEMQLRQELGGVGGPLSAQLDFDTLRSEVQMLLEKGISTEDAVDVVLGTFMPSAEPEQMARYRDYLLRFYSGAEQAEDTGGSATGNLLGKAAAYYRGKDPTAGVSTAMNSLGQFWLPMMQRFISQGSALSNMQPVQPVQVPTVQSPTLNPETVTALPRPTMPDTVAPAGLKRPGRNRHRLGPTSLY